MSQPHAPEITKGQLLAYRLGQPKDRGAVRHEHISMVKRNNVAHALELAQLVRDILGANGIVNEYPVIRRMLNLETVNTYEGAYDMHTLIKPQRTQSGVSLSRLPFPATGAGF